MSTIRERSRDLVSLRGFIDAGIPEPITMLDLHPPEERQYILRMAVSSEWGRILIPSELYWVRRMLSISFIHQTKILQVDHPFCYITVRHGIVDSLTDDEWHVDGFSTNVPHTPEQNYVWCSNAGTEYVPTDVTFPKDFDPLKHNVHSYLQKFVDPVRVRNCDEKVVCCLDPYLLHRRPTCTMGMQRTFVRISFVPIEINDINNTQNPLLHREYTRDGVQHRNALLTY